MDFVGIDKLSLLDYEDKVAVVLFCKPCNYRCARNAGLPCISVLWGFRDRDFLIQHGAKTFISAPQELLL